MEYERESEDNEFGCEVGPRNAGDEVPRDGVLGGEKHPSGG